MLDSTKKRASDLGFGVGEFCDNGVLIYYLYCRDHEATKIIANCNTEQQLIDLLQPNFSIKDQNT